MLAYGRGRWAVSQKRIMIQQSYSVVPTVVRYPAVFECLPWYQFRQYVLFQRAEFDAFLYSYARQVLVSKKESCTDWVYVSWSRSISAINFLGWLFEQSLVYFYFFSWDSRSLQICLQGVYFIDVSRWICSVCLLNAVRAIFVCPWKMVSVQM